MSKANRKAALKRWRGCRASRKPLTVKQLKQLLHYDSKTGIFTWLKSSRIQIGKGKIGAIAGTVCSNGYRKIGLDGKRYYAERLAWFYMTGKWPHNIIRHLDGVFDNNRWDNLQDTTHSPTEEHRRRTSKTLTGVKHTPERAAKQRGKPAQYPMRRFYYKDTAFRSSWELFVAKAFDRHGIKWEFETKRFDLGRKTYAPDFYLPEQDCFWEVKGYYGPQSRETIKNFRERYPEIALVVATEKVIKQLDDSFNPRARSFPRQP